MEEDGRREDGNSKFGFHSKSDLKQALRALAQRQSQARTQPILAPTSTYEALLDERIKGLEKAIGEIRNRLNTLFFAILSAVALDVITRWLK